MRVILVAAPVSGFRFIFHMKKSFRQLRILLPLLISLCDFTFGPYAQDHSLPIAFPSAEGYGKFTSGGRGGKVYIVSTLLDSGQGSLRAAVSSKEPLIIVFAVAGTIHLNAPLSIRGNKTLAGQTAPGDGICLADNPVIVSGDNVIIRYLRFRLGDRFQNKGMVAGSGHDDALSAVKRNKIIIDHCSFSWSTDECLSIYGGDSTTLQWNLIAEPLNSSYHFEEGDTQFENHGYGGIWGGKHLTAHHNLFAHCLSRNPRFNGNRLGATFERVDFRNNIIYNWGNNNVYGGEGGEYNIVGNYYKYGPSTRTSVQYRIVNPTRNEQVGYGKFYVADNYVDGSELVTKNNRRGVDMGKGSSKNDLEEALVASPFMGIEIIPFSARDAYNDFIAFGGCSFPTRDSLDQRILRNLIERRGLIIDVQGGYPAGTSYENTKNAWPFLRSTPPAPDSDQDGMPDQWEISNGLDPNNSQDASINSLHRFYTNIEIYINNLIR